MSNHAQNPIDETVFVPENDELFGIQGVAVLKMGLVRAGNGAQPKRKAEFSVSSSGQLCFGLAFLSEQIFLYAPRETPVPLLPPLL